MGNATSRTVRKLPKTKGSCVPPAATAPTHPCPEKPLAFESKNEAIEQDAKDPHFMEKLSRLGSVRVDHPMRPVQAASDAQDMYRSRMRSETEAARTQTTRNRLLASSLVELLEARKSVGDGRELEALAKRYHVDVAKLEQIARVVNTPSVDASSVARTTDKHGEESLTMKARWVDPVLSRA